MSYGYHITRKADWSDETGPAIQGDEWLQVAATIENLHPVSAIGLTPETSLKLPPAWLSHGWFGHPEHLGSAGPVFKLTTGSLDFGGDDPATMSFALGLAERLGARVVGDEGEEHTLASILEAADDRYVGVRNPFTGETLAHNDLDGVIEIVGAERHLKVRERKLLGLLKTDERLLLHFVVPAPAESIANGSRLRVRGPLSKAGTYGAARSCSRVLYVLRILR